MTMTVGTAQQLAALIVEKGNWYTFPKFVIRGRDGTWGLAAIAGDDERHLCSTRDVAQARTFATIEAALRMAQHISGIAGCNKDHGWTEEATRLGVMPTVEIYIDAVQP